jgi:hypothetical protein
MFRAYPPGSPFAELPDDVRAAPVWTHVGRDLEEAKLALAAMRFSTAKGDTLPQFRSKLNPSVPQLVVVNTTTGVLCGRVSFMPHANAYVADAGARLYDATGAFKPSGTNQDTFHHTSHPAPTWGAGHCLYLGSNAQYAGAYAKAHATYRGWTEKANLSITGVYAFELASVELVGPQLAPWTPGPCEKLKAVVSLSPIEYCRRVRRSVVRQNGRRVTMALAAPPQCGKSSLMSALASVVAGEARRAATASGAASASGQHTAFHTDHPMFRRYAPDGFWETAEGVEIMLKDLKGFTTTDDLDLIASGVVRSQEVVPAVGTQGYRTFAAAVRGRATRAEDAVLSLIVCVPARLVDGEAPEVVAKLMAIFEYAKQVDVTGCNVSLDVVPVLTMVDEVMPAGCGLEALWSQGAGPLRELVVRAARKFGPPAGDWLVMGYLDSGAVSSWGQADLDPRAAVARAILDAAVGGAALRYSMLTDARLVDA